MVRANPPGNASPWEIEMRRNLKKLALHKETLRSLDEAHLAHAPGAYPFSTATNCDACGTDGCGGNTFTCGSSCCPYASGCTGC